MTQTGPIKKPSARSWTLSRPAFVTALAVVAALLVGLVIFLLASANANRTEPVAVPDQESGDTASIQVAATAPATALPVPRDAAPSEFTLGDCFANFNPEALKANVVACDSGHSAQLVALFRYPAGDSYPGVDVLQAKALEACEAAKLSAAADQFDLNFQRAYPSESSWGVGDRRVDCYVTAPTGNVITASVLP